MADTFAFLKARFHHALLLGLGSPALVVGCGPGEGIENDDGFVAVTCDGTGPSYLAGVVPSEAVDYLALDQLLFGPGPFEPWQEVGEPCATASDVEACMTALYRTTGDSSLRIGGGDDFIAYSVLRATRGDDVIELASDAALRDFLLPIDSTADAVLLATSAGFDVTCGRSGAAPDGAAGYRVQLFTHPGCDGRRRHLIYVDTEGQMEHLGSVTEHEPDPHCVVGRRPAGLIARGCKRHSVADHFARSAELEAASVHAFESLERELVAHGAPRSFALRSRRAARDEVRHVRCVARLARSLGGKPRKPCVVPLEAVRSLETIALENAIEGCVRETYGALVAQHQAARARSSVVRRLYARIAEDETRHAALAWDIARWADTRASAAERRRIRAALHDAVHELSESTREPMDRDLAEVAGLPQPGAARLMLGALVQTLWARTG